jgi:hypothetical protein
MARRASSFLPYALPGAIFEVKSLDSAKEKVMKIWIALTVIVLTVLVISNLESKDSLPSSTPPPNTPPLTQTPPAAIVKPMPRLMRRRSEPSSEHVMVEPPTLDSSPETVMAEPSVPEAATENVMVEQPIIQPQAEPTLDLVSLKPGKPADPDPIMLLRSTEIVRPNDGPTITLTYGDVPKLNLKVEHRSWTTDPQVHSSGGAVASDDTTGAP